MILMKEIKKRTGLWTKTDYLYFRLGSFSTFTKKNAPLLTAVDIQKKLIYSVPAIISYGKDMHIIPLTGGI